MRIAEYSAVVAVAIALCATAQEPDRLILQNERLTVALGKAAKGAIVSLVHSATGRELVAEQKAPRLFLLGLSKQDDPGAKTFYVSSQEAEAVEFRLEERGGETAASLRFANVAGHGIEVTCTAAVAEGDPLVRWRLSARLPEGLVLEDVQFPLVTLRAPLREGDDGEAWVMGATKGGVYRQPSKWEANVVAHAVQPGSLAAQFACYYDAAGGLFTATHDAKGYPKIVKARRTKEGLEVTWGHYCFAAEQYALDYDVALTTFRSSDPTVPTDWRDGADIYKQWAVTQPWCARTYREREDIPRWLQEGPAMVRFSRFWLADTSQIEKWFDLYWRKYFADGPPLIIAYWGWEKVGSWVTPDYFPVYPSDEEFRRIVGRGKELNGHAFLWPSGYHYTLTYGERQDGSFEWDDRERFNRVAAPHAVHSRDGKVYAQKRSWLRGGETSCMCPGDPWTIDWLNNIGVEIVRRGVEMVQVDQVVGGAFPACYSRVHGHPPGPGRWQAEVFRRQLETMLAACRQIEPEAVVCFEEPNELFIQQAAVQDYRDWEILGRKPTAEAASVFNYVYHEYLPTLQSNPRPGNRLMHAYCLVNGQIPHFIPHSTVGAGPAPLNGGFEEGRDGELSGWQPVKEYAGRVFGGEWQRDASEKHSGTHALRLRNAGEDDVVQVSQNVPVGDHFAVGKTYRLSAWVKTQTLAKPNGILAATLTTDLKSTGGSRIAYPGEASDWAEGQAEFTVAPGSDFLRIMCHLEGGGEVWIDDVLLEEVLPDGTTKPVKWPDKPREHDLMRQWVELFSGEGRPYLLWGTMLHPPPLEVPEIEAQGRKWPAILHNAYRAPDGSEATVAVNVTDEPQRGMLTWKGKAEELALEPWEVRLIKR